MTTGYPQVIILHDFLGQQSAVEYLGMLLSFDLAVKLQIKLRYRNGSTEQN